MSGNYTVSSYHTLIPVASNKEYPARTRTRAHTHTHRHTHRHPHTHIHTHTHPHTPTHTHGGIKDCTILKVDMDLVGQKCVCVCVCVCVYVCVCVLVCVCLSIVQSFMPWSAGDVRSAWQKYGRGRRGRRNSKCSLQALWSKKSHYEGKKSCYYTALFS